VALIHAGPSGVGVSHRRRACLEVIRRRATGLHDDGEAHGKEAREGAEPEADMGSAHGPGRSGLVRWRRVSLGFLLFGIEPRGGDRRTRVPGARGL
jgi:hypothetical protein